MAHLGRDVRLLFAARITRQVGLNEQKIGLLLTFTPVGDVVVSLRLTTSADRIGRRRMLIVIHDNYHHFLTNQYDHVIRLKIQDGRIFTLGVSL